MRKTVSFVFNSVMHSVRLTHVPPPQFSLLLCETTLLKVLLTFFLLLSSPLHSLAKRVCLCSVPRITFPSGKEWSVKSNLRNGSPADIELGRMQLCQWQIIFDPILHCYRWQFSVVLFFYYIQLKHWLVRSDDMANIDPFLPTGAYSYVTENDVLTPFLLLIFVPFFFLWIRNSQEGWALNQSRIFSLLDGFVQRCMHLLEVIKWSR